MGACFRSVAVGVLVLVSVCVEEGRCWAAGQIQPQDAVVLVTSYWRETRLLSHGVAVGDGSLVLAFYPMVFDELPSGRQHLAKRVTVASPYWGDIVDANIVAADANRRIALLQVPWRGHPALRLADDRGIAAADLFTLVGMPAVLEAFFRKGDGPAETSALFQQVSADLDYVGIRDGKPLVVVLRGAGGITGSWTGAPILLPDTGQLVTTVSTRFTDGAVEGEVLNRMTELTARVHGLESGAVNAVRSGAAEQGQEAFLLSLRIASLLGNRQFDEVATACRRFIELRPHCFYGYIHAALAAEGLKQASEAQRLYQEAATRAPGSLSVPISYAGFLDRQDRTAEAIPVLECLWPRAALRPYLVELIEPLLTKRHEHNRCLRFLEEALAVDPNNAYALIGLGNQHNALQEYEAAAEAFGKAAELWPQHDTVRAHLARNLELAGRWDEADAQYRKSVEAHPESEFAHHTFASFLARRRPQRRAEALEEARAALRLPHRDTGDRERVEKLIRDLEAKEP